MKNFNLPDDYRPYIDKYFLRSKEILQKENLNPKVMLQVFIRKGLCYVYGVDEAIAIIQKYAPSAEIWALKEGLFIENCETIMTIKAPVQDIIDLETMYLGVISAETTLQNDKQDINLKEVSANMAKIVELVGNRAVIYMGARHWRYDRDFEISKACFEAGAKSCSTGIGASSVGSYSVGTIPHALEAIYHYKYGIENAVVEATKAFNKHIDKDVPRIALIDYANQEIIDTFRVIAELDEDLFGVRIDTCGENYMQGVLPTSSNSKGVSLKGAYLLRKLLNDIDCEDVKIVLSSGFANADKTKAFVQAEKELNIKLFDMLGVGQVFTSRVATGDIVEVDGKNIHKVGRPYRVNERLEKVV
jgi:nicotinate phosphoribosyltransferase